MKLRGKKQKLKKSVMLKKYVWALYDLHEQSSNLSNKIQMNLFS